MQIVKSTKKHHIQLVTKPYENTGLYSHCMSVEKMGKYERATLEVVNKYKTWMPYFFYECYELGHSMGLCREEWENIVNELQTLWKEKRKK